MVFNQEPKKLIMFTANAHKTIKVIDNEFYQKITKKLLQRQNINNQINSRFMPATHLKMGTFVLIPNFITQKGIS